MDSLKKIEDKLEIVSPLQSPELVKQIEEFKKHWSKRYEYVSKVKTLHKSKTRKVGKDKIETYLEENYMRSALDKYFPGWSWKKAFEPIVIADRGIVACGELEIIDVELFHYLTGLGIPKERAYFTRSFFGMGGAIIQASKESGQVVSANWTISNPAKSADTEALKYSVNRLTRFGDDTYRKEDADIGLTSYEFMELSKFIIESNMLDYDKEKAFGKLQIINSSQIEELIDAIKSKEQ